MDDCQWFKKKGYCEENWSSMITNNLPNGCGTQNTKEKIKDTCKFSCENCGK